ncbi:MAG: hypothetical protein QOF02_1175 [Blastocatellia bacterium]|jgi:hypothetical protein|nr:hypothetical protein [Blastocatellia bacterium]
MKLVNETNVAVSYWITAPRGGDCGTIAVNGMVDLPYYDTQQNVSVEFLPVGGAVGFSTTWGATETGQQTELTLVAL